MNTLKRPTTVVVTLVCLASMVLVTRTAEARLPDGTQRIAADRQTVIDTFYDRWLRNAQVPVGWTGNVDTCTPGTTSAEAEAATIDQINFYRELVGSPPAVVDRANAAMPQRMALIMQANGALAHYPPPTWRCYQEPFTHNLVANLPAGRAIASYIQDLGPQNFAVLHRRALLDPRVGSYAFGSTDQYNAVLVGPSANVYTPLSDWVAWPPAGLIASPLVPYRWSFDTTRLDLDLSSASASVIGPNGPLPVTVLARSLRGIVFEVTLGPMAEPGVDLSYTATISGITKDGVAFPDHTYVVTEVRPDRSVAPGTPPTIAGTPQVGSTLTATRGTWNTPGTTSYGRWFRDGGPIYAAGSSTQYTLVKVDRGRTITFREVGENSYYLSTTMTSNAVSVSNVIPPPPAPAELTLVRRPRVRGILRLGRVLTALAGRWQPEATTTRFKWLRGGDVVGKGKRLRLTSAFLGKKVVLRVTARRSGYQSEVITVRTRRVRR